MTPSETAKGIVEMFLNLECDSEYDDAYMCKHLAQKAAILHCQGIIDVLNKEIRDLDVRGNVLLDFIEKYRNILKEIEKL